jgi:hypothetical protein
MASAPPQHTDILKALEDGQAPLVSPRESGANKHPAATQGPLAAPPGLEFGALLAVSATDGMLYTSVPFPACRICCIGVCVGCAICRRGTSWARIWCIACRHWHWWYDVYHFLYAVLVFMFGALLAVAAFPV